MFVMTFLQHNYHALQVNVCSINQFILLHCVKNTLPSHQHCAGKNILRITLLLFPWVHYEKPRHKPPRPDVSWTPASRPPRTSPQKYQHPHSWRSLQSVKRRMRASVWKNILSKTWSSYIWDLCILVFLFILSNSTEATLQQRETDVCLNTFKTDIHLTALKYL